MCQEYNWHALNATLYLSVFFIFMLFFSAKQCNAEEFGFDIEKLTAVAERDKARHGEPAWFRISGTNIKAGEFRYNAVSDFAGEMHSWKAALLINNSVVYYVTSDNAREPGAYDIAECHFGVYKDYFLMDCFAAFSTGHGRSMFLFRYGKDKVELLDVIEKAYVMNGIKVIAGMDFISVSDFRFPPFKVRSREDYVPIPAIIKEFGDLDNDNAPEVRIEISRGLKFIREFDLYLEIKNDKLGVDLNPELYKPLFEQEKKMSREGEKSNAYYIYGFLSGKFTKEWIKAQLAIDKEQYDHVLPLLENRDRWDAAFHEYDDTKPVLKRYDVKWR